MSSSMSENPPPLAGLLGCGLGWPCGFGRGGLGIFPAPLVLSEQLASEYDAQLLGDMTGVAEQIHAISTERKIRHPAIEALCRTVSQSVTQPPP